MPSPVTIPLINPNEPEALVAALHVQEGQKIARGDPLCSLETTKSTMDLHADTGGYVAGLRYAQGDTVRAGEILCYLSDRADWTPPEEAHTPPEKSTSEIPDGLRISKPALKLAREHQIDLGKLPVGPLITEKAIQAWIEAGERNRTKAPQSQFDPTALVVYGGGGHGKSVIDLVRALGTFYVVGVLDDALTTGESILGTPVLGGGEKLKDLYQQGIRMVVNAVGGIGDISVRIRIFERIAQAGFGCPTLVHPSAVIEPTAKLLPGVQVFPQAYVGSDAQVGFGGIVNTGAIVSHACVLGDFANVAPGATLAGEVEVGRAVLIGMGVTVNLGVEIGERARIGNGATVKADVPSNGIVRAGSVYPD